MKTIKLPIAALVLSAFALPAIAQNAPPASPAGIDQRQAEQKQRIEQGVASGKITAREAANLQKGQDKVQRMEDRANADGRMSRSERNEIKLEQDRQASNITRDMNNREVTRTSNIDARQANQQARIDKGVATGDLTRREAARLEQGQAKVQQMEANAKADGVVTAAEREAIRAEQNRQSQAIKAETRDNQVRK